MFLFLSWSGARQVWRCAADPRRAYVGSPLDAVALHSLFAQDTRERDTRYPVSPVPPNNQVTKLAVNPRTESTRVNTGPPAFELEPVNKPALGAAVAAVTKGPIRDTGADSRRR